MTWTCHAVRFRAESEVTIGSHKLGVVQRTRYFIPARVLWGAATDRLTKLRLGDAGASAKDFAIVGAEVDEHVRFSCFYACIGDSLALPWNPTEGLTFGASRAFEARLVESRTRTAVSPTTHTAQDTALFEVECISKRTSDGKPVDWCGYVWLADRLAEPDDVRRALSRIEVGGERRYGMGRLRLLTMEPSREAFGMVATGSPGLKLLNGSPFPGYVKATSVPDDVFVEGSLEPLQGRMWHAQRGPGHDFGTGPEWCWAPGTRFVFGGPAREVVAGTFGVFSFSKECSAEA